MGFFVPNREPQASPGPAGFVTRTAVIIALLLLLLLLTLPLLGLVLRVPPGRLLARLGDPAILQALKLSLLTSLSATVIVIALGLPAAYLLARREFRGKRVVEALVDLPMVLPPTVAGLALLLALGRNGLAGETLNVLGIQLPFTTLGVVVAQTFMAVPFFIGPARAGFASVDQRLLDAATTLRASESFRFYRVMVPLALPSLLAGATMSWARALGEFGATITFAGNLPGLTQTMPLAVYDAMQSDLEAAIAMAVLLTIMALGLLLILRQAPGMFHRSHRAPR
jgi:molybdate transport system permease protein